MTRTTSLTLCPILCGGLAIAFAAGDLRLGGTVHQYMNASAVRVRLSLSRHKMVATPPKSPSIVPDGIRNVLLSEPAFSLGPAIVAPAAAPLPPPKKRLQTPPCGLLERSCSCLGSLEGSWRPLGGVLERSGRPPGLKEVLLNGSWTLQDEFQDRFQRSYGPKGSQNGAQEGPQLSSGGDSS